MAEYNRLAQKPREENFVIVDFSADLIRAGLGVHETLRRPFVEIAARAGKRRASEGGYLVGAALEEAERSGEDLDIVWPLSIGRGVDDDRSTGVKGKSREVDGIEDWGAFEALLSYILFTSLGLPARPFAYHLHLALPAGLAHHTHELITQMCFERLHLPALLITERPLLCIYAVNAVSGTVIEVGRHSTEVHVAVESTVYVRAATRSHVGQIDLDNYLCHLILAAQPDLPAKLSPSAPLDERALHEALLAIVQTLRDGDFLSFASAVLSLNVAADGSRMEEEVVEKEETLDDVAKVLLSGNVDTIIGRPSGQSASALAKSTVTVSGEHLTLPNPIDSSWPSITVGPERHRFAEPLFDPSLLRQVKGFGVAYTQVDLDRRALAVPEAVAMAIRHLDLAHRYALWQTVVVLGPGSARGVPKAIMQACGGFIPVAWGKPKLPKVPDYFPEYKDRMDLVSFLGASIVAKIGFLDSTGQFWVNKADYSSGGPTIVSRIEKPPLA